MHEIEWSVLPGSWIYPQSVDFWDRKLSVDGSRQKVEFCGFLCLLLILSN